MRCSSSAMQRVDLPLPWKCAHISIQSKRPFFICLSFLINYSASSPCTRDCTNWWTCRASASKDAPENGDLSMLSWTNVSNSSPSIGFSRLLMKYKSGTTITPISKLNIFSRAGYQISHFLPSCSLPGEASLIICSAEEASCFLMRDLSAETSSALRNESWSNPTTVGLQFRRAKYFT